MSFALRCLLCGITPADLAPGVQNDLVRMQEHAMEAHEATQEELVGGPHRHEEYTNNAGQAVYVYRFANGTAWLEATRVAEGVTQ